MGQAVRVVGRESELGLLRAFVGAGGPSAGLLLTGGPGIGKTTLWEAGVDEARERGVRVLVSRASGAETQLSFAAVIDLLDGVDVGALEGLPGPQRRALEVALMRAEPTAGHGEPQAAAVGFLNAVRILAAQEPLLLAIDDVQWLDGSSVELLAYAARRLEGSAVRFLVARRTGRASTLESVLEERGLERIDVLPLSLGAIRHVLSVRLGLSPSRQLLRRIVDATLGNPLFALEVGRTLADQGPPGIGQELPVPEAVEDLLGTRVARLPEPVGRLLLAVALNGGLRPAELASLADEGVLDDAVDGGILIVEGDRVRVSHPLLAAAAVKRSTLRRRRELHLELARVVGDAELRARNLALATARPDEDVAAVVAAASEAAAARGAREVATELGEQALRLTPPASPGRHARLLAFADSLVLAGEKDRATKLLLPEVESLPPGASRARAWTVLASGALRSNDDIARYFELALAESEGEPTLRASVLTRVAENAAVIRVERIGEAEARALEALELAPGDAETARLALYTLAWARSLRGRSIDDVCERFAAVSDVAFPVTMFPQRVAAQRLFWRGDVDAARAVLAELLAVADERGESYSYALLRLHMCQLEQRVGDWAASERILDEWAADRELLMWPMYQRSRALLASGRGLPDETERWTAETLARSEETGTRWDRLEALRARGTVQLLGHEPEAAVESLREVWEHLQREGVDEPGVFPVAPVLVEALVEVGDLDEARSVTVRLDELAHARDHPWAAAAAMQCQALVRLAGGEDDEAAVELLERAAGSLGELGLRFDHARALLQVGRAQRRRRKWAAARQMLEQAAAEFDAIGSPGWAQDARAELARVGGRRAAPGGGLTPTERSVADLAAEGLANKEIAQALHVTVHTVETHLSSVYAKLGVRSRSQLASRLARG
jgi:DNA-binding CsgD family transcriptional regulator